MNALTGLTLLLVLQTCGELLARAFVLPFPGPVIGLLLLLVALRLKCVQERVGAVAEFLLNHLSLLFVPVGVGVMTHLGVLAQYGWRLAVVIVVSTWIGLAVTALCVRALLRDAEGGAPDRRGAAAPAARDGGHAS